MSGCRCTGDTGHLGAGVENDPERSIHHDETARVDGGDGVGCASAGWAGSGRSSLDVGCLRGERVHGHLGHRHGESPRWRHSGSDRGDPGRRRQGGGQDRGWSGRRAGHHRHRKGRRQPRALLRAERPWPGLSHRVDPDPGRRDDQRQPGHRRWSVHRQRIRQEAVARSRSIPAGRCEPGGPGY